MKRLIHRTVVLGVVIILAGYMPTMPQAVNAEDNVVLAEGTIESIAGLPGWKARKPDLPKTKIINFDRVRIYMNDKKVFSVASDVRIKNTIGNYISLDILEVPCKVHYTASDGVIKEISVISVIPR